MGAKAGELGVKERVAEEDSSEGELVKHGVNK